MTPPKRDLLPGTLEMLVLKTLSVQPMHGYGISQHIQRLSQDVLRVEEGWRDIVGLVVGQGARFAVAGLVTGSTLALFVARWIQPLLFQQSARDPLVFMAVGAILIAVALLASGVPALRATRADPNTVLRTE